LLAAGRVTVLARADKGISPPAAESWRLREENLGVGEKVAGVKPRKVRGVCLA